VSNILNFMDGKIRQLPDINPKRSQRLEGNSVERIEPPG